jgi:hypothetical protein
VKTRKNVGELRYDIGAIRWVFNPSVRKLLIAPKKKRTFQPGDPFEDTTVKPGFEID